MSWTSRACFCTLATSSLSVLPRTKEGPWVTLKRSELREVLLRAHECLSEPSMWHTEPEYTVKHAKEAVAIEPFRETSYRLLMRAHAVVGNRAEALRVYERCRRLLSEELGVP